MNKSKIVFEQSAVASAIGHASYVVASLTNRTTPRIGEELTESQVKKLMSEGRDKLTVEIKPKKAK